MPVNKFMQTSNPLVITTAGMTLQQPRASAASGLSRVTAKYSYSKIWQSGID
jgi:hypothetical protein